MNVEVILHLDTDPFYVETSHEEDFSVLKLKSNQRVIARLYFAAGNKFALNEVANLLQEMKR